MEKRCWSYRMERDKGMQPGPGLIHCTKTVQKPGWKIAMIPQRDKTKSTCFPRTGEAERLWMSDLACKRGTFPSLQVPERSQSNSQRLATPYARTPSDLTLALRALLPSFPAQVGLRGAVVSTNEEQTRFQKMLLSDFTAMICSPVID